MRGEALGGGRLEVHLVPFDGLHACTLPLQTQELTRVDGAWIRLGRLQSAGRCLQSARCYIRSSSSSASLLFNSSLSSFSACLPDLNIYGALHSKSSASPYISHQILQSSTSFCFFRTSIESCNSHYTHFASGRTHEHIF